jgi:hypothetical protein
MSNWESKFNEIIDINDQKKLSGWGEDLKLKRAAKDHKFISNEKEFEKELKRIGGCKRYLPCPICFKCLNKSSHLDLKCQICRIPICVHTYEQRKKMIKRKNFELNLTDETKSIFEQIGKEAEQKMKELKKY